MYWWAEGGRLKARQRKNTKLSVSVIFFKVSVLTISVNV